MKTIIIGHNIITITPYNEANTATKLWRIMLSPFVFLVGSIIVFALHTVFPIAYILELYAIATLLAYCLSYPFIKMGADIPAIEPIMDVTDNPLLNHFIGIFMFVIFPFNFTYGFLQTGLIGDE